MPGQGRLSVFDLRELYQAWFVPLFVLVASYVRFTWVFVVRKTRVMHIHMVRGVDSMGGVCTVKLKTRESRLFMASLKRDGRVS